MTTILDLLALFLGLTGDGGETRPDGSVLD